MRSDLKEDYVFMEGEDDEEMEVNQRAWGEWKLAGGFDKYFVSLPIDCTVVGRVPRNPVVDLDLTVERITCL